MSQTLTWRVLVIGGGMDHGFNNNARRLLFPAHTDRQGLKFLFSRYCSHVGCNIPAGIAESDKHKYFTYGGEDPSKRSWLGRRLDDVLFAGADYDDMLETIKGWQAKNFGVLIIGHSLGGATGYSLARKIPKSQLPVILVTLDPVGRFTRGSRDLGHVTWYNVYAESDKKMTGGDVVAGVGGAWDKRDAIKDQGRNIPVPTADHEDVHKMLQAVMPQLVRRMSKMY